MKPFVSDRTRRREAGFRPIVSVRRVTAAGTRGSPPAFCNGASQGAVVYDTRRYACP